MDLISNVLTAKKRETVENKNKKLKSNVSINYKQQRLRRRNNKKEENYNKKKITKMNQLKLNQFKEAYLQIQK